MRGRSTLLTFRSVLRTQMKVQTDGLLQDFRTTNPPGPFSPLTITEQHIRGRAAVVVGVQKRGQSENIRQKRGWRLT